MTKNTVLHKPGDSVNLAGIDFVVLDNNMAGSSDEPDALFILAVNSQGQSRFGDTNNYAESSLKNAVYKWLYRLNQTLDEKYGIERPRIINRTIDLLTLDGYKGYGTMDVPAAPLTLDEAWKYKDIIPQCNDRTWLATGWGEPKTVHSDAAWSISSTGDWDYYYASSVIGIRPALVIPSCLLDSDSEQKPDMSRISTNDLLTELRRRLEGCGRNHKEE